MAAGSRPITVAAIAVGMGLVGLGVFVAMPGATQGARPAPAVRLEPAADVIVKSSPTGNTWRDDSVSDSSTRERHATGGSTGTGHDDDASEHGRSTSGPAAGGSRQHAGDDASEHAAGSGYGHDRDDAYGHDGDDAYEHGRTGAATPSTAPSAGTRERSSGDERSEHSSGLTGSASPSATS